MFNTNTHNTAIYTVHISIFLSACISYTYGMFMTLNMYIYIYAPSLVICTRVRDERISRVHMCVHIIKRPCYRCTFTITPTLYFYVFVLPSSRLLIHWMLNAHLYIYSLFSFLYASDTFLPITTYRYHRQSSLSMHEQRDGPKVVKSRQGKPIPGPREDFATVWHRPGARCDITTSFSSRNLTVLSSLP